MTSWKRVGNSLLALGGLVLAALMVYSLFHDGVPRGLWGRFGEARPASEVVVFFPDRSLWHEFIQGVDACSRRRIARIVRSSEEWVELETPGHARRVRLVLNDVRGVRETREAVDRIAKRPSPPVAIVGSSNTVLTVAIADALRGNARDGQSGPLLLVPWATAVLAERAEPERGPVALLDIDPGRTFRFCPNNQTQADMLTHACLHGDGKRPGRVDAIVDRLDPYSVDLADSFHRAIERALPDTELVSHGETIQVPGLWNMPALPSLAEEALAESIWAAAEKTGEDSSHWVILPLQAEPARRMLTALRRHARGHTFDGKPMPLRVLCGDGIGLDTLAMLAGQLPFPVWCYSPGLAPRGGEEDAPDPVLHTDAAVLAEVVAALIHGLDVDGGGAETANALRDRLHGLDLPARSAATLGRSIVLAPSGERVGEDLGYVLLTRAGGGTVYAMAQEPSGKWSPARPVAPSPWANRP